MARIETMMARLPRVVPRTTTAKPAFAGTLYCRSWSMAVVEAPERLQLKQNPASIDHGPSPGPMG